MSQTMKRRKLGRTARLISDVKTWRLQQCL